MFTTCSCADHDQRIRKVRHASSMRKITFRKLRKGKRQVPKPHQPRRASIPFQDDNTERSVEICSLDLLLVQSANASDQVIFIADTRHTQRWSEREVDPMLCKGDLAFFCNCFVSLEDLRLLGTRAQCWHPTKRGHSGNTRTCGRSRSDR